MCAFNRVREQNFGSIGLRSLDWYQYSNYSYPPTVVRWPQLVVVPWVIERCVDQTHPGPPYREGGPLDIWKRTFGPVDFGSFVCTNQQSNGIIVQKYEGLWRPPDGLMAQAAPSGWLTTWGDGSSYGATAWKKFKPGKPGAELSVFIGEMRDIPRMFQLKLREFKDLGSQYLNYQFGWRPFLNDIRKFIQTTDTLARRLDYLRRNNGKPIRRGGIVKQTETSTPSTVTTPLSYPVLPYQYEKGASLPPTNVRTYEYQKIWFEAVFQFWIPDIDSPEWLDRVKRQMYGLNLSPAVVWELIPWSWLVDWFTNVGDVMSNFSTSDEAENLVARYAYLMTHTVKRVEYHHEREYYDRIQGITKLSTARTVSSTFIQWERKQRVAANPFGFGVTWDGLTLRQLMILAALGITRQLPGTH